MAMEVLSKPMTQMWHDHVKWVRLKAWYDVDKTGWSAHTNMAMEVSYLSQWHKLWPDRVKWVWCLNIDF